MPNIGVPELLILLVILLLIFGPKRLPGLGRQLGSGMREFKDSITGKGSSDDDTEDDSEPPLRALNAEPAAPAEPSGAHAAEGGGSAVVAEPSRDTAPPAA
jgi:sec-independent protein translocase protein TatA